MTRTGFMLAALWSMRCSVEKQFAVYMLTNKRNGTLYVGVTAALAKRVWEHKEKVTAGFTARYGVDRLVYYELHDSAQAAIEREKRLKRWKRAWKVRLIEEKNPDWCDLYESVCE